MMKEARILIFFSLVCVAGPSGGQAEPTKHGSYYYSDRLVRAEYKDRIDQTLDELAREDFELKKELMLVLHGFNERYGGKYAKAVEIIDDVIREANAKMDTSDPATRWELARVLCEAKGQYDRWACSVKLFGQKKDLEALIWGVSGEGTGGALLFVESSYSALKEAFVSIGAEACDELAILLKHPMQDDHKERIALILKDLEHLTGVKTGASQFLLGYRLKQITKFSHWFLVHLIFFLIPSQVLFAVSKTHVTWIASFISNVVSAVILSIGYVVSGAGYAQHIYMYYGLFMVLVTSFVLIFSGFEDYGKKIGVCIVSTVCAYFGLLIVALILYGIGVSRIGSG